MRRVAIIQSFPSARRRLFRDAGHAVLVLVSAMWLSEASVHAQSLEDEIRAALQPPPSRSRGIAPEAPAPAIVPQSDAKTDVKAVADRTFVDTLRSRSITIEAAAPPTAAERAQVYAIASARPAIDLEVLFEPGSAEIGTGAAPTLAALGQVLSRSEFKGEVFFINGYTDAKGSPGVNQRLSQQRAEAVRRALIARFRLAPDTLIAVGFGKERLKDPGHPFAAGNRRVQIVNTTVTAAR